MTEMTNGTPISRVRLNLGQVESGLIAMVLGLSSAWGIGSVGVGEADVLWGEMRNRCTVGVGWKVRRSALACCAGRGGCALRAPRWR